MGKKAATPRRRWEPTALSRLIARRLHELGLRQSDLAARLHVDQSYVSQLVAGRLPAIDAPGFAENYARALEMDTDIFIAESELWRYNIVPPREGQLSPAREFLLAVTEHLSDETVYRLARGVREQYGEPPPEPPLAPGRPAAPLTTDPSALARQDGSADALDHQDGSPA